MFTVLYCEHEKKESHEQARFAYTVKYEKQSLHISEKKQLGCHLAS